MDTIALFLFVMGLALLIGGAEVLLRGATHLAAAWGISPLVVGLTVVAFGTSSPELAVTIQSAWAGQSDIALGNIVGSNIFNILSVLGLTSLVSPKGINVPIAALSFDIPVMIAAAVACLPIFFNGHKIARWEGGLLFGYYLAYTLYLILKVTEHTILPAFVAAMVYFVLPLTTITLAVLVVRTARANRRAAAQG